MLSMSLVRKLNRRFNRRVQSIAPDALAPGCIRIPRECPRTRKHHRARLRARCRQSDHDWGFAIVVDITHAAFLNADFQKRGESRFLLETVQHLNDAKKILRTRHLDVVLLDLVLGETQGLDTLSAVRAAAPNTPVVVLTASNDEGLALQALKRGARDYRGPSRKHGPNRKPRGGCRMLRRVGK